MDDHLRARTAELLSSIESHMARIRLLEPTHLRPGPNLYIRYGCIGISGAVFLAWQFALRKEPLGQELWAPLDRILKPGTYLRVRRWLENNFLLTAGTERVRPWTMITNAFSHYESGHLAGNMIGFNAFSAILSVYLSSASFCGLIASTAVAGSLAFLVRARQKQVPGRTSRCLGLSGVVIGMGTASAVLFPQARVSMYGVTLPIQAAYVLWVSYDWLSLYSPSSRISHATHLGGATAGLIYGMLLKQFGLVKYPSRLSLG